MLLRSKEAKFCHVTMVANKILFEDVHIEIFDKGCAAVFRPQMMFKIRMKILLACSNFFCFNCFDFLGQHFSKEKFTIFKEFEIFAKFYNFLVLTILLKLTKFFMREYMRVR